jgi:hypothetical protein
MLRKFLITLALVMALCVPSYAVTIDFNVFAPSSGTISYAGGTNPLIGTDIQVFAVKTDSGNPILFTDNVVLNFTTGNFITSAAGDWSFGSGGSISIVDTTKSETFLTGSFTSVEVEAIGSSFKVALAGFTDTKTAALLQLLGLSGLNTTGWDGNMNLSFIANGMPGNAFCSSVIGSGDVSNYSPVPIPPSALLYASGLLGFIALRGRRRA